MITPQNVVLTVNRACNNRCFGCYAETEFGKKEMALETAKKLIDICVDLNINDISLLGGEPTLYSQLSSVVEYATKNNISSLITTNGRKFSDYSFVKKLSDIGLWRAAVSVKGYNTSDYIAAGGADGYNEATQGLINLQKLGIPTTISTVIFNKNLSPLKKFILDMTDKGFKSYVFSVPAPNIENDKIKNAGMLSPKESAESLISLYSFMEKLDVKYRIMAMMPACLLTELPIKEMYKEGKINFKCSIPTGSTLCIGNDGEILPCNHIFNYPLGEIKKDYNNAEELINFWNTGNAGKYRNAIKKYPSIKCIDCELWSICGGGCLLKIMAYPPDECIIGIRG